jgi:hypothetical protein
VSPALRSTACLLHHAEHCIHTRAPRSYFTKVMKGAADRHCGGKLLFFHEGGYS